MNRNWEKRQNRKNMFLAGAKSMILTAAVIPVLGLAVHGLNELGTVRVENYSVKNRFECAYCFNVPESNKYYYSTPIIFGDALNGCRQKEYYAASPWATYSLIAGAGVAGAVLYRRKQRQY